MTVYFRRGSLDATASEDAEQIVGINSKTGEIVDDTDLIYVKDVPDLSGARDAEEITQLMEDAGWEQND